MKLALAYGLSVILTMAPAFSQSLKPEAPSPLQAGINKSVVDNFVGTQYWYFMGGPGKTHVHAQFKSMGLLGNASRSDLTITLYDEGHTWHTTKSLTSEGKSAECTFDGDLKKPTRVLISVAPPSGGLVRTGGDYELEGSGAITFGQQSTADPVIRTYNMMGGYTKMLGACKFLPDGTIQTASGETGNWKLFDKADQVYVINIDGQERHSLQYHPGRGLLDGELIIFQELR